MHRPRPDLSAIIHRQRARMDAVRGASAAGDGRLAEVPAFGPDPGALRMLAYLPAGLPAGAPLVVALHGCTQTAAGYDAGSGWSAMADRLGFALLLPEQRRANNPNLCFNWFEPGDVARGSGEATSIRAMIEYMVTTHGLDRSRVFVTGLSAGGAMAAVMLAAHPEVFAAGAIVAGLPYGAGMGVADALKAMARPSDLPGAALGGTVRRAGSHRGPWPRVAVWHGDADATVHVGNADASVRQWLDLHGLGGAAAETARAGAGAAPGHAVRRWRGADGTVRVECHRVAGMGHGVPLHAGDGEGRCGTAGAYMLDVGVSSTHGILAFWGIEGAPAAARTEARAAMGHGVIRVSAAGEARTGLTVVPRPAPAPPSRPVSSGPLPSGPLPLGPLPPAPAAPPPARGAPTEVPDAARTPWPASWAARSPVDIAEVINAAHRAAGLIGR